MTICPSNPKFSIVTISYNHAEFIEDSIRSVQAQNYPHVQHIVIDAGSTDGTLAILKKYPHLEWISEPDRGICHALNKGFAKCTGDIVAWLNSDDWYAPGCFTAVAEKAKNHKIILGDAVETNRTGVPVRTIKNVPRNYFDATRYWVPDAWFAQPSVFFTRDLLMESRLPNGEFMDESFRYSMDAEFWLRIGEHADFKGYIPQILSYFRVYGENKTGRTFAAPRKELGRAFRKAYARIGQVERPITMVLPIDSITKNLTDSMAALLDQSLKDFELFIVDYSNRKDISKSIQEMVLEMEEHTLFGIKYLKATAPTQLSAWNTALGASRASVTGFMAAGVQPANNCLLDTVNIFNHDLFAALLPFQGQPSEQSRLRDGETGNLNLKELVVSKNISTAFFGRTLALRELGGFKEHRTTDAAVKGCIMGLMQRSWGISFINPVAVKPPNQHETDQLLSVELYSFIKPYEQALLVFEAICDARSDIFYPIREVSKSVPIFTEAQRDWSTRLLATVPKDFLTLNWLNNLEQVTQQFPQFAPGWFALSQKLNSAGKNQEAYAAFEHCKNAATMLAK